MSIPGWLLTFCLTLLLLSPALPATADDFPPITAEETAITAETLKSKEPAIVLFRKGEFHIQDFGLGIPISRLVFKERLKILTEEGKAYGEISVPHSSARRLQELQGRTVLPDGRILPLQVTGKQQFSQKDPSFVTVAAFDGVEVGAILDYQYEVLYASLSYLHPWYFQSRIPTRYSEFSVYVPPNMGVRRWARETVPGALKLEANVLPGNRRQLRAWAENLPAIPLEPFAYPFSDLATQYMVLPTEYALDGFVFDQFGSWEKLEKAFYEGLRNVRFGRAESQGKDLARGKATLRDKADALYRFVRDEIRNEPLNDPDGSIGRVLSARQGSSEEKALLLKAMLAGIGLDAQITWASTRDNGIPDMKTPNLGWFDTTLVHLKINDTSVFLLPTDRSLAFGQLPPNLEGTPALVLYRKNPTAVTLPTSPFTDHTRDASVQLALGEDGQVTGSGTLQLGGHWAWQHMGWKDTPEATSEAWREWLQENFSQYQVGEVTVEELVDERRIKVRWQLQQSAEEVLGDEATIQPSLPLGPLIQLLPAPPETRRTPALVSFPYRDEVYLTLTWPAGWDLDLQPENLLHESDAGSVETQVKVDPEQRQLTYLRYFQIDRRNYPKRQEYAELRNLFGAGQKQDAQPLVLIRR